MTNPKVELQANMYVFDLNNSAKEHWFKANEGWELSLANDGEKSALEKKYKPTLSAKALPETLLQLYGLVKAKLEQPAQDAGKRTSPGEASSSASDMQYLVAYNPDRLR